jgi:hypothetical protein
MTLRFEVVELEATARNLPSQYGAGLRTGRWITDTSTQQSTQGLSSTQALNQ